MYTRMFALASGLIALRYLPALPSVGWLLLMLMATLLLLAFRVWVVGLFLLGLTWGCVQGQRALDDRLADSLEGRTLWVEGRVVGLPQQADAAVRFELQDARSRHGVLPATLRLSWYGGPPVNSGERWRLAVKLKQPGGLLNPRGFDYQAWLLARRIGATGTVKDGQLLSAAHHAWRDSLRQRLLSRDANGRAPWLAALIMGDGSGLSRDDWKLLQATGTVHLLVISGQHIGLCAGLIYGLASLAGALWAVAARLAVAALGLRPGVCGGNGVRRARGFCRAGTACVRDAGAGADMASSVPPSGGVVALFSGTQRSADH